MIDLHINLSQLVQALSQALDLAEYQDYVQHGQRVAYIAVRIGQNLGLSEDELKSLYYGGLLHDIGITSVGGVRKLEDEKFILDHGELGAELVAKLPLPGVSSLVRYHHECYDGSGITGLKGDHIPFGARLLSLADSIDGYIAGKEVSLGLAQAASALVQEGRASLFDPDASDAVIHAMREDKFWFDLRSRNLPAALGRFGLEISTEINSRQLESIALVFAEIIDSKSCFTRTHSVGLAKLVRQVAQANMFPDQTCRMLYTAGLLHDLGKLAIPKSILEKPSRLTPEEYYIIKSHVYYTKMILSQVRGLKDIANWAGNHHERLDGRGYADRLPADKLSIEDRLMAVCDVYQALTEERPYRVGESSRKALEIIETMVKNGGLCPDATRMLAATVI